MSHLPRDNSTHQIKQMIIFTIICQKQLSTCLLVPLLHIMRKRFFFFFFLFLFFSFSFSFSFFLLICFFLGDHYDGSGYRMGIECCSYFYPSSSLCHGWRCPHSRSYFYQVFSFYIFFYIFI